MSKLSWNRSIALFLTAVLLITVSLPAAKAKEREAQTGRTKIGREDHVFVELPGFVKPAEPSIHGAMAILVELNSGTILYAKNMNQKTYPASTTKVLTALLALENLELDDTVPISYNATHDLISGGFDGRFLEGQVFTVEEALYGLCLDSVNTLGYALAEKMDGDVPTFAARMNARAAELGALFTSFTNPHGLNDLDHITTAYDMAKILWGAIEIDDYRRIAGSDRYSCAELKSGQAMNFSHTLRFLHPENNWYDSRIVCGKTGWTEDAHFCRAVYATNGELDLICVVFNSTGADNVDSDVKGLLDYGFNNYTLKKKPVFSDSSVLGGVIPDDKGEEQTIHFEIGEGRVLNGSVVLAPTTYANLPWTLDLRLDNGQLKGYAALGGVALVEYPLVLVTPEETTASNYFPTVPPITVPGESESGCEASTTEKSSDQNTETAAADTTNAEAASVPDRNEGQKENGFGANLLTLALIICAAFFVLCLVALLFTLGQNRRLRRRVDRRNALKKDS